MLYLHLYKVSIKHPILPNTKYPDPLLPLPPSHHHAPFSLNDEQVYVSVDMISDRQNKQTAGCFYESRQGDFLNCALRQNVSNKYHKKMASISNVLSKCVVRVGLLEKMLFDIDNTQRVFPLYEWQNVCLDVPCLWRISCIHYKQIF